MWSALCLGFLPLAAVTGQVALEQHTRELAVRAGDRVTFQCSMSGGSMSNYYMFWYRQGPRGALDWVWQEDDNYGEGFQGRFKGSVVGSQNRLTLQIQAAKQGDEAVYFCGVRLTLEELCSRVAQKPRMQPSGPVVQGAVNQRLAVIEGYVRQKVVSHHAALALFHIDTNQMDTFHSTKACSLIPAPAQQQESPKGDHCRPWGEPLTVQANTDDPGGPLTL